MSEQAAHFAADVRRLLLRSDEFVEVNCPACSRDGAELGFRKADIRYLRCESCGTIYASPRPTPEILRDYYSSSANYRFWADEIFPASEETRRELIMRPRLRRLASLCDRFQMHPRILVEVGAGFGTFCDEAARSGLFEQVIAVEPTPPLAERCRRLGLSVVEKPIEEVLPEDLPNPDVIACFETIEHLFDPSVLLGACHRQLREGGLLFASCPNGEGFDVVVLGEVSDTVDAEHLNYFNPRSLSQLIEAHGFEVLEVLTPGELDAQLVRRKAMSGEWDPRSSPFLRQVLVEQWDRVGNAFQDFLAANLLSSHLWVVARKR
ncbi:MAG: class I SAM-dependent methyltransferase [Acidimicrobiales bacterium]